MQLITNSGRDGDPRTSAFYFYRWPMRPRKNTLNSVYGVSALSSNHFCYSFGIHCSNELSYYRWLLLQMRYSFTMSDSMSSFREYNVIKEKSKLFILKKEKQK